MDHRDHNLDPTRDDGFVRDVPLNEFFSRPIRIAEYEWDVNASPSFNQIFDPWTLYWENARVLEKIKNYYLLKCKLCVKILINGNPFYYGRCIAAYAPLDDDDDFKPTRSFVAADIVRLSQRMHMYINPTTSEGGVLELPFFWYKNALSIPDKEWRKLGNIQLVEINKLAHANQSTDPLTITVMAWADDVSYSIPCRTVPESDEHEVGVISRPASTIASIASRLKDIPVLKPFAMATEVGAGVVGHVAKIFGYSAPVELKYTHVIPTARPSLAVTDTKHATQKLTVDSKQEITLDPRTTGIGPWDELSIKSIACRESYLTTFDWTQDAAVDTLLFNTYVDPCLKVAQGNELHFPACCVAAYPFSYWRGSMRLRFQVVSSNFHKGRLRVVYDPQVGGATSEFNTHYTTIHDIADGKDFTVDVGWAQTTPHRRNCGIDATGLFSTSALTTAEPFGNGVLSVYVLNKLTAPASTDDDIQINVFISMLDDFEVAVPNNLPNQIRFRFPTTIPEMAIKTIPESDESPDQDTDENVVADPTTVDNIADVDITNPVLGKLFFGEHIGSFRQMLKRDYLYESNWHYRNKDNTGTFFISRPSFPAYGGYLDNSVVPIANTIGTVLGDGRRYITANTVMLNYIAMAFKGWRGSNRWTLDVSNWKQGNNAFEANTVKFWMGRAAATNFREIEISDPQLTALSEQARIDRTVQLGNESYNGVAVFNARVNPIQSVEVPFYSELRFLETHKDYNFSDLTTNITPSWFARIDIPRTSIEDENVAEWYDIYHSIGEDFNLFFYNGFPPLFRESSRPSDPPPRDRGP